MTTQTLVAPSLPHPSTPAVLPMAEPLVYVVDDDADIRNAMRLLIHQENLNVETFACGEDFLAQARTDRPACLILDLHMPGIDGLDLQARLAANGVDLPIIMLTGHGDVPAAVRALHAGAVDFLQKPVRADALLPRIREAIDRDRARRQRAQAQAAVTERRARLTPREHEVMERIVDGQANKVVAIELGISERTVELHRSKVMQKMEARSLAELMHLTLLNQAQGDSA